LCTALLGTHWAVLVLDTAAQKSIAQYPIQPSTGKYWAIPNTQMLVLF